MGSCGNAGQLSPERGLGGVKEGGREEGATSAKHREGYKRIVISLENSTLVWCVWNVPSVGTMGREGRLGCIVTGLLLEEPQGLGLSSEQWKMAQPIRSLEMPFWKQHE